MSAGAAASRVARRLEQLPGALAAGNVGFTTRATRSPI
jgi:hypothetical protein